MFKDNSFSVDAPKHNFISDMVCICIYDVVYIIVIIEIDYNMLTIVNISMYTNIRDNIFIRNNITNCRNDSIASNSMMNLFVHFSQRRSPVCQLGDPYFASRSAQSIAHERESWRETVTRYPRDLLGMLSELTDSR
jgi:hypothetical protein